jgi:hypothetical protein
MHDISPGINGTSSLPFKWGDTQNPRNMKNYAVYETGLIIAGANENNEVGERLQDFLLDWLESESGEFGAIDPITRYLLIYNPYVTRGDHTTSATSLYSAGEQQFVGRTGWTTSDSWFMAHFAPIREIDHDYSSFGEFQYWKNDTWAVTHPLAYQGTNNDTRGTNGVSLKGVGLWLYGPHEYREVQAQERETTLANYLYITGTQGGSIVWEKFWGMPHTFFHEHTRSFVWLPDWDVVVIHDRTNADTDPDLTYPSPTLKSWMTARPLKEIYFHTRKSPVAQDVGGGSAVAKVTPTHTDNYSEWEYHDTNKIRITHLLPVSHDYYLEDEDDLYVWPPYPWHGSPFDYEKNSHIRIVPTSTNKWDTFLNVWDVYDTGTPATVTLVQDTRNDVDGALITKGTENVLVAFNAVQGTDVPDRWKGDADCTPGSSGGFGCHDKVAVAAVLDNVRIRDASYSLTFTPAGGSTTKALLFDLDTNTEWDYNIDGGANADLTVDANGIGVIDITDTGEITLNVIAGDAIPVSAQTDSLPKGTT